MGLGDGNLPKGIHSTTRSRTPLREIISLSSSRMLELPWEDSTALWEFEVMTRVPCFLIQGGKYGLDT